MIHQIQKGAWMQIRGPGLRSAVGLHPTDEMQGIDLLNTRALKKRKAVFGAGYPHDAVDIEKPVSSLMDTYVIEGCFPVSSSMILI